MNRGGGRRQQRFFSISSREGRACFDSPKFRENPSVFPDRAGSVKGGEERYGTGETRNFAEGHNFPSGGAKKTREKKNRFAVSEEKEHNNISSNVMVARVSEK